MYRVRGSTTAASRYFLLECRRCRQAVTGSYGKYDARDAHQEARQRLSQFVVAKDAYGAGAV